MRIAELGGRRVAIWGAGREGAAALRALARRLPGERLAVICRADEVDALCAPPTAGAASLHRDAVDWHLAPPTPALLAGFEVVVKSPGISPYVSPAPEALALGARFTSGSALWFAESAARRTIGITGTKGKSTTTALVAHLLRRAGLKVALAGNIGLPLLDLIDPPIEPDWWVLELSSFQIADLGAMPEIGAVLNLYPEHLDWHLGVERYFRDKMRLLGTGDGRHPRVSVVNARHVYPEGTLPARGLARFGDPAGFHVRDGAVWQGEQRLVDGASLALPGAHNLDNLAAALTIVAAAGIDAAALAPEARDCRALPHRLAPLGERDGLLWVDDSIATTPHATLAALAHFDDRVVTVLVGGHDRGLDWTGFAAAVMPVPPHRILCFGAAGPRIAATLAAEPDLAPRVACLATLDQAVVAARTITPEGGVILLSPGAPSFDAFRDYAERGRHFAAAGGFPAEIGAIEGLGL
jgi:UDP-N-acetylmuramoylalanine--D-glutamate ligase